MGLKSAIEKAQKGGLSGIEIFKLAGQFDVDKKEIKKIADKLEKKQESSPAYPHPPDLFGSGPGLSGTGPTANTYTYSVTQPTASAAQPTAIGNSSNSTPDPIASTTALSDQERAKLLNELPPGYMSTSEAQAAKDISLQKIIDAGRLRMGYVERGPAMINALANFASAFNF